MVVRLMPVSRLVALIVCTGCSNSGCSVMVPLPALQNKRHFLKPAEMPCIDLILKPLMHLRGHRLQQNIFHNPRSRAECHSTRLVVGRAHLIPLLPKRPVVEAVQFSRWKMPTEILRNVADSKTQKSAI